MLIIILIVGVFYLQRLQLTKTKKSRSVLVVYYYIQRSERKKTYYTRGKPLHASCTSHSTNLPCGLILIPPFDSITHHSPTITLVPLKTLD